MIIEPIQGENGVVVPPAGYLEAAREITRGHRHPARPGRGADRHRPHRPLVRVPGPRGRRARRRHPRQGARRRTADRRHRRLRPGRRPAARPASTARPSAATRSPAPPALAVLDTIAADGLLDHVKRPGERLRDGIEALGPPAGRPCPRCGPAAGYRAHRAARAQVQQAAQDAGFLVNAPAPDVVRLDAAADPRRRRGGRVPPGPARRPRHARRRTTGDGRSGE